MRIFSKNVFYIVFLFAYIMIIALNPSSTVPIENPTSTSTVLSADK